MSKPLVIQTEHLDADAAAWLAERCELVQCPPDLSDPRFAELLARADGLVIRTYTQVNEALLAKAPRLRVVARAGVGLDNVDQPACKARGVAVLSTPGANTRSVVEYVFALIADVLRPRESLDKAIDQTAWNSQRKAMLAEKQLSDLTMGIIGLGRVGSGVCRVAKALDMRVVYHDLLDLPADKRFGGEYASPADVYAQADILTLHPDGRKENRHLLNAAALKHCKPDVLILNTARGFLVDNAALVEFLRKNPKATAVLDVHEPEPFGADYPLLGVPNARLLPHLAAATRTAHRNMSWVVRELWEVLAGEMATGTGPGAAGKT